MDDKPHEELSNVLQITQLGMVQPDPLSRALNHSALQGNVTTPFAMEPQLDK